MTPSDDLREAVALTDQQIRDWVVLVDALCGHGGESIVRFDRWLAAHDAALSSRPALPAGDEVLDKMLLDMIDGLSYVDEATDPVAIASTTLDELEALRAALASRPSSPQAGDEYADRARHMLGMAADEPNEATGQWVREAFEELAKHPADERGKLIAEVLSTSHHEYDIRYWRTAARRLAALESDGQEGE